MVQFLKVPVSGTSKNFENQIIPAMNYFNFKILLIAIDWNF